MTEETLVQGWINGEIKTTFGQNVDPITHEPETATLWGEVTISSEMAEHLESVFPDQFTRKEESE